MKGMRAIAAAVIAILTVPPPALAWGFEAHKFIAEQAIALLPPEVRPIFEQRRVTMVERAVDPDLWRNVWEAEAPNHFVDLDYFGTYPYEALPREYDRAVQKWGRDVIHQQGLLPWRGAEFFGRLQREFERLALPDAPGYVQDNIVFYATVLGHYVADAHVPLHTVVNYDGQRTNQRGVHGRWESALFDRVRTRLTIAPAAPSPIRDPREFLFDVLLASNRLAEGVLTSDREAAAGREFYDDAYFAAFERAQRPVLQQRINDSITALASMIIGAWEAAGRPALPPEATRAPRPVKPRG